MRTTAYRYQPGVVDALEHRAQAGDVEAYSTRTAAQRLVGYLLNLCGASGSAHFPTSKYVVASLLNLTPETLSRILHTLTQAEPL